MNKLLFSLVGATLMVGSVIAILDGAASKKKRARGVTAAEVVLGVAGLVAGTIVALRPEMERYEATVVSDMVSDDDEGRLHKHIHEVLGDTADRGKVATHVREIELDSDASIEDFIV
jgi:hypothetical protein